MDYTAYLKPNIMELMPDYVKYQKLEISITSNNSLTVKILDTEPPVTNEEKLNKLTAQDFDVTVD